MTDCQTQCLQVFSLEKFSLDYYDAELFLTSQWPVSYCGWIYFAYRVLVFIAWLTILVLSCVTDLSWYNPDTDGLAWFAYLTHWELALLTVDSFYQAVTSLVGQTKGQDHLNLKTAQTGLPVYLKLQWIIANTALGTGIFATVTEGMVFYPADYNKYDFEVVLLYGTSVYLLINMFISGMPMRVMHFYYTTIFVFIYVGSASLMYAVYNLRSFTLVAWNSPFFLTLYCFFGAVVGVFVTWTILYGLYRLRLLCCSGYKKEALPHFYDPYY